MSKIKFVIFEPDGYYGYPRPVISDDVLVPHDSDVIFQMYGSSSYSAYNMGELGWNYDAPDDDFVEYGKTELYEGTFLVLGLNYEEIKKVYDDNFDKFACSYEWNNSVRGLNADWFIEAISKAGGACSEIPILNQSGGAIYDLISDPEVIEAGKALEICVEIFSRRTSLNDPEKDAFKQALAKRGDIDQETIDAIEGMARVKKRNK